MNTTDIIEGTNIENHDIVELDTPVLDDFFTKNTFVKSFEWLWETPLYKFITHGLINSAKNEEMLTQMRSKMQARVDAKMAAKAEKTARQNQVKSVIVNHIVPFNNIYRNSLFETNSDGQRLREIHRFTSERHLDKYKTYVSN